MKLIPCLFTLFAAVANAQAPADANNNGRELAVARLNTDLAHLQSLPANRGASGFIPCLTTRDRTAPRPEECGPVDRVMADLALVRPSGPLHAPTRALSYNLVISLSGRELEPNALSLLTNSLVDAVAIAERSVEVRTRVSRSRAFRDSVMQAYAALFALGVGENGAEACLRSFVRNSEKMSTPPDFEPIPPAPIFR